MGGAPVHGALVERLAHRGYCLLLKNATVREMSVSYTLVECVRSWGPRAPVSAANPPARPPRRGARSQSSILLLAA